MDIPIQPNNSIPVVINHPPVEEIIHPFYVYESLLNVIKVYDEKFIKTISICSDLSEKFSSAKCFSCEVNKNGLPLISTFYSELMSVDKEIRDIVFEIIGNRVFVGINKKWVNVKTQEERPFEYRDMTNNLSKSTVTKNVRKVLFTNFQGPGDVVMITAAIRDLHINYPGKFITDVKTSSQHIWEGNPYVEWAKGTPLKEGDSDVSSFRLQYPLIHQSNQGPYHFSESFTEEIEELLNVRIKRRIGKGDIHIRKEEDVWGHTERSTWFSPYGFDPNGEYWIIDAGHKSDFTAKFWGRKKFQDLVNHYKGKIQFVQIGHSSHIHPVLDGVINLIGKTDDRQLIRLIWASSGVVTPVSFPMTLAAAIPVKPGTCKGRIERPCVVIGGGREPSHWQAYCNHQFIHTNGALPCCDRGGCWKSRTRPIGDGDDKDKVNMCENVTVDCNGEEVPFCMHMISVEDVIRRIDTYYQFYDDSRAKYTYNKREQV